MDIVNIADQVITQTYARYPLALIRGQGCTLFDDQGRAYTDFIAGIAVCNLGHAHPKLIASLVDQAERLWHVSNLYYTQPQAELAAWLTSHSFADRVFFANSGAEANEAAIKLARKFFNDQGQTRRFRVVSMQQSFHGRTMAALSATGQEKVRKGFDPLLEGFDFAPFNAIEELARLVGPDTCAVIMEPIQGEGGVICPERSYLEQVRQLCDRSGCLLIFDEVQTGIGRTGKLFAHEHFGIHPDIMTLAKALGNGLPDRVAMLATEQAAAAFGAGAHRFDIRRYTTGLGRSAHRAADAGGGGYHYQGGRNGRLSDRETHWTAAIPWRYRGDPRQGAAHRRAALGTGRTGGC
jgi:acetylornithine/N-succinyldiaminopimelate aminotransferase